ncbi:phage virion morphogenesis protein [Serratia ficaria]|uniref:phage virion morphogenesis protein n=1 Tax=Serratia ficaria TaxID=61651 RepID=UPI0021798478|nr:phage virion morphogenesis protein [Serratia ficaria]CAI1148192.1 Mu-like prophage protein gpG [Serratia ficaria]CAI2007464.1 Mu-like prophage protein gpG [Serratia ficaria]CAI2517831.1 Mu-like prophage protein gpG [Serratia ficaria]
MNEFKPFDDRLAGLIASLSAPSRRQMAAEIAKRLRAGQQQRIKQQQAPDGTPYAGRKRQRVRGKKGRVKRGMFTKLRTNRFMKAKGAPDEATVEFIGRVQRIAQVHQYGLRDRPSRNGREVQYPARPLLGFSDADRQIVEEVLVSHLSE